MAGTHKKEKKKRKEKNRRKKERKKKEKKERGCYAIKADGKKETLWGGDSSVVRAPDS